MSENKKKLNQVRLSVAEHFSGIDSFILKQLGNSGTDLDISFVASAVPWDKLWDYLKEVAVTSGLQDCSEVGTTWVGHFIDKKALYQLNENDLALIGGKDSFLFSTWQSTMLIGDNRVCAVPWVADTRVIYYWKNELRKAGIDDKTAFSTIENMESTLDSLHSIGSPAWGAPTFQVNNTLHQIASWIWGSGGDFIDETGRRTRLLDKETIFGICKYYQLYRYMPNNFDSLDSVLDMFEEHNICVTINGPWYLMRLILGGASEDVLDNLGVAIPPGPPFVGGSNLVIWDNASIENKHSAIELIDRLTSSSMQREICKATGLMPVREDLLNEAPYSTDSHYRIFTEALRQGRPLPMSPYWGLLEESLLKVFGNIWEEVKILPYSDDIEDLVISCLEPTAKRFDRLLRLV